MEQRRRPNCYVLYENKRSAIEKDTACEEKAVGPCWGPNPGKGERARGEWMEEQGARPN